jgi:hypothetical protein
LADICVGPTVLPFDIDPELSSIRYLVPELITDH